MFSDPTSPPVPSRHPLTEPLIGYLRQREVLRERYDESQVTELLDRAIGEFKGSDLTLPGLEHQLDGMAGLDRFALELHRARRFYERPESAAPYQAQPTEGATMPKLAPPKPDFHERVAAVGDHPALLRRLGLVIELRVADPARLLTSEWLSARVVPRGDTTAGRLTRVRCAAVGDAHVTVPETSDWHHGRLRLGDTERFSVLDMDPDGSALKLDRFVWTLPRLLAVEQNGDPIHAAPTALRSTGFTVARSRRAQSSIDRQTRQTQLQEQMRSGRPPLLSTEDVTRGVRVEVWDDDDKTWSTLHARLIDLEVFGLGVLLTDVPELGFIQGTAATETVGAEDPPVHVHESMFGWDGWSLAAPKPGLRVRHVNPPDAPIGPDGEPVTEVVEPVTETPLPERPLVVTNQVAPGTLPRLRYGRSYAFRAWAVDLAGNSRPHAIGPAPSPSPDVHVGGGLDAGGGRSADARRPSRRSAAGIVARRPRRRARRPNRAASGPVLPSILGEVDADRLDPRAPPRTAGRTARPVLDAGRASIVGRAFRAVVADPATSLVTDTRVLDATAVSAVLAGHVFGDLVGPTLAIEADTVSPLRPFLRWDPVGPPAVVAKHPFSAGESLRQIVVRSGVAQDLETLAITVTPPVDYAADPVPSATGRRRNAISLRRRRARSRPSCGASSTTRSGRPIPPSIVSSPPSPSARRGRSSTSTCPSSTTRRQPTRSSRSASSSDATVSPVEAKTLPLAPGEAPAPGQYVVHGVDELRLPYLPDVRREASRSCSRRPAGTGPSGTRSVSRASPPVTAASGRHGEPFRLVLGGAAELQGRLDGRVLRIDLPPGDQQRFRLASSLDRDDLDRFGLWRSLPAIIRDDPDIAEAVADGWLWAFTPFEDVTLVHAVPRPLEAPRPTVLRPAPRPEGSVEVVLTGAVDVHGPSTDSLTLEARWSDTVDDLSLPGPEEREERGVAFTTPIHEFEDLALLAAFDLQMELPTVGPVRFHKALHRFGDTRHRMVRYRFRASTRFREYFDPPRWRRRHSIRTRRSTSTGRRTTGTASSARWRSSTYRARRARRAGRALGRAAVPVGRGDRARAADGGAPPAPCRRAHLPRAPVVLVGRGGVARRAARPGWRRQRRHDLGQPVGRRPGVGGCPGRQAGDVPRAARPAPRQWARRPPG